MAYNKFTEQGIRSKLNIEINYDDAIFREIKPLTPRPVIESFLQPVSNYPLKSEIARREWYIVNVFREILHIINYQITIYSGERFDIAPELGLSGEADYLITRGKPSSPLRPPIIAVAEAKPDYIPSGLGQCIAEMYAAKIYNERAGITDQVIYGIITTGLVWSFLRLTDKLVEMDPTEYTLPQLNRILGIIVYMTGFEPVNVYQPE
jgi:hypothetical protein